MTVRNEQPTSAAAPEDFDDFEDLLNASSLGAPHVRAARESVPEPVRRHLRAAASAVRDTPPAAQDSAGWKSSPVLVVDCGGGTTDVALGTAGRRFTVWDVETVSSPPMLLPPQDHEDRPQPKSVSPGTDTGQAVAPAWHIGLMGATAVGKTTFLNSLRAAAALLPAADPITAGPDGFTDTANAPGHGENPQPSGKDTMTADPSLYRRKLRLRLRMARADANLSRRQVSEALDWSLSKLMRIETAQVAVSVSDMRAMARLYGIDDPAVLEDLEEAARGSRGRRWWTSYDDLIGIVGCDERFDSGWNLWQPPVFGLAATWWHLACVGDMRINHPRGDRYRVWPENTPGRLPAHLLLSPLWSYAFVRSIELPLGTGDQWWVVRASGAEGTSHSGPAGLHHATLQAVYDLTLARGIVTHPCVVTSQLHGSGLLILLSPPCADVLGQTLLLRDGVAESRNLLVLYGAAQRRAAAQRMRQSSMAAWVRWAVTTARDWRAAPADFRLRQALVASAPRDQRWPGALRAGGTRLAVKEMIAARGLPLLLETTAAAFDLYRARPGIGHRLGAPVEAPSALTAAQEHPPGTVAELAAVGGGMRQESRSPRRHLLPDSHERVRRSQEISIGLTTYLLDAQGQLQSAPTRLTYQMADPYAVRIAFRTPRGEVVWNLARELLVQALDRKAGRGDVIAWSQTAPIPVGQRCTFLVLRPGNHTGLVAMSREQLRQFLEQTRHLVQIGTESGHCTTALQNIERDLQAVARSAGRG